MRLIPLHEKRKRGCQYCADMEVIHADRQGRFTCPFEECVYPVLDKYDTYEEFMASEDSKIMVTEFFQTVASCYELSTSTHSPNRSYSDGENWV